MKLFNFKSNLSILAILSCVEVMAQNFYVNKEWETEISILGSDHLHAASVLDQNGNVFSVANKRSNGIANIFTAKMNPHGNLAWEDMLSNLQNGSTTQNYGTDVKRDIQGNIFICGAYYNGNNYDMIVVKYNTNGTEAWRSIYNGTGNSDDAPASMALDQTGNVYVTGGSFGSNSLTDFLTLKLNGQTGAIVWNARYDFNHKYDGATAIKLDNQGNVYVCGSSAQNNYNSDFVVIKYNPSNGNQLEIKRHNTPQNGYDIPIGMEIDQNNKVYVLGSANFNLNSDLKLISYNSNLNVNWVTYFDGSGLKDEAGDLDLDNAGNLVITGTTKNNLNENKMLTAKYDRMSGNLIWKNEQETNAEIFGSSGKKIKTDQQGNIVTLGEVSINGISHVRVTSLDPNGKPRWERINENPNLNPQLALDLIVDGNDIFLTGVKELNNDLNLFTIKLQQKPIEGIFVTDGNGNPMYARNHLIIRFQKEALKLDAIDHLETQFGKAETFLRDEAQERFFNAIKPANGTAVDYNSIIFYRIYRGMTSTETIAISHLGEEIEIPTFYGAFLVEFPEGFEVPTVANQLPQCFPTVIYSDPVLAKIHLSNDPSYPNQSSLHPTAQYPNSGVNVEEAWNYEVGKSFVKVGVFDNGVRWDHEDFGNSQPNQSNVKKSYNFVTNTDESTTINSFYDSHGTSCAGIIGGLRNNNKGIAGIAGGTGTFNNAVSLYSLRILQLPYGVAADELNAIYNSTQTVPTAQQPYRYGLNIQSHSWRYLTGLYNGVFDEDNLDLMRDNLRFASRFKTTIVAGRGNEGIDTPMYPASMDDDWILTVGGTGSDGEYWDGINDGGTSSGNFGFDVDIAAPASSLNVYSATKDTQNSYASFSGTSSATPHVAGTVALLMSNYNTSTANYNNLSPEDCENIIELSATDIGAPNYEPTTGFGRLNAGKALVLLDPNLFALRHIKTDMYTTTKQVISMTGNDYEEVNLLESYTSGDNISYAPQLYHVRKFKIRHDIQHDIDPVLFFRSFWTRPSSSNVLDDITASNEIRPRERVQFEILDHDHAVLFGYVYAVYTTSNQFLGWWPRNANSNFHNMEYSLLLTDDFNASVINLDLHNNIKLFPNPSSAQQTLSFDLSKEVKLDISLVDATGKEILKVFSGKTNAGKTDYHIDLSNLSEGLYVYKIMLNDEVKHLKTQKL
ncbi:MAG: S8 family serine peptidase [Bacteroidota bacterium]